MEAARLSGLGAPSPDTEHGPNVANYTSGGLTGDGNVDYIISDYMERLGERLNILETELKYAWSALDLLSQEYIKMWERLEKLEGLLYEQQTVISQLIEFYTSSGGRGIGIGGSCSGVNNTHDENEGSIIQSAIGSQRGSVGELDAIAKSLGPSMGIEETSVLREKLAQQEYARMHNRNLETLETLEEEENAPDEAFYRSLNNAYREDLICGDTSRPTSQLGMIWEEAEDIEDSNGKKGMESGGMFVDECSSKDKDGNDGASEQQQQPQEQEEEQQQQTDQDLLDNRIEKKKYQEIDTNADEEGEIFSAADYKSYRGNTPCVSEQDLVQLSKLSSLDQVALEKLHELDKLTSKLQKDSQDLIELNSRLMDSPKGQYNTEAEAKLAEEASNIDEQLRKIYAETDVDNWTYSKSPGSTGRSISRVSTDSGLATDGDFTTRSISPRLNNTPKSHLDSLTLTYTPPRLSYTTSLLEKSPETVVPLPIDPGNFAKGYAENKELTDLMADSFVAVTCASPTIFNSTADKLPSPTLSAGSVHSIRSTPSMRTRRDGYFGSAARLNFEFPESRTPPSPSPSSPPPPAPRDSSDAFIMTSNVHQHENAVKHSQSPTFLRSSEKSATMEQGRLSPRAPHSPKSPKISPKHVVKSTNIIVAAKSDSGLSSMSGWSSLDKSPSSPKSSMAKIITSYSMEHSKSNLATGNQSLRPVSPIPPLPEVPTTVAAVPIVGHEPLYDTPEGRDAFGNISSVVSTNNPYSSTTVNHISAYSSVKSPASKEDYIFVPPPAPSPATCQSPKKRSRAHNLQHTYDSVTPGTIDCSYRPDQPAIYSVAGSNRQNVITGVYTSSPSTIASRSYGPRIANTDQFYSEDSDQYGNYQEAFNSLQFGEPSLQGYSHVRKPTKALSYGEGITNHEGYKVVMYRNMFPTGNITDALSYYPTSANLPRTEPSDSAWINTNESQIPHDSTSSSIRSLTSDGSYAQSPYNDRRYAQPPAYQAHQYHHSYTPQTYQQQYQPYNSRLAGTESTQIPDGYQRQWQREHQHTREDSDSNGPTCAPSQTQQGNYYDASSVIVSQSGYISISSDIKDHEEVKVSKKVRRGASLKNAMSSMSHWLPDLHLTKRHRSHSLPGGVRRDDMDETEITNSQSPPSTDVSTTGRFRGRPQATRKKKKHTLVSTVSGILQKAKRRNHHSQSMSDPEQSETEWSSGRQSGLSEDEDSVMSDVNQEPPFFAKVRASQKRRGPPPGVSPQQQQQQQQLQSPQQIVSRGYSHQQPSQLQQQQLQQQQQQQKDYFQQQYIHEQQAALQHQIQQHQELLQQQVNQDNWKDREARVMHDSSEQDLSDNVVNTEDGHDGSGKSTGSGSGGSTSMFPTVGDIKRSTGSSDEAPNEKAPKLPSMSLMGGASMEFAVSRALGKYRQRQSSTVSDDQPTTDDNCSDKKSEDGQLQSEPKEELALDEVDADNQGKNEKISSAKPPELVTSLSEEAPVSEGSPSASSTRGFGFMSNSSSRFLPRHQQSLEIPWAGSRSGDGDEDNRSTHSYRSTSRVSSRRQSTEDSIDSEDEWYCYELRKLEELERQSQIEIEMGEVLVEEPEESEPYQPTEDVKERMSFVLRELKLKAVPVDDNDKREHRRMNGAMPITKERQIIDDGKPIPKKKTADTVATVFARVTDYHTWAHEEEARREERVALLPMDEGSSGETSGPDSPVHSMDELEEDLDLRKDLEEQSRRSSSGSTMRRCEGEKIQHGSDSLSREGSVSVPPSEVSVSIPGAWDSESAVLDGDRDGAGSAETTTATLSLPKIKIDSSSCGSSDTTLKEGQVSPGLPGSKWKLLKALKERKAEEKLKEVEDATAKENSVPPPPASVSIMINFHGKFPRLYALMEKYPTSPFRL
ncbi:hypothetical protein PV326_007906 [Microctonus aethiopoides]|nr:hypothetical protein PV326_007906 [Microctonus aethiopoides]